MEEQTPNPDFSKPPKMDIDKNLIGNMYLGQDSGWVENMEESDESLFDSMVCDSSSRLFPNGFIKSHFKEHMISGRRKRKLRQAGFASRNDRGRKCRKVSDRGPSKSKKPTQIDEQMSQPTQIDTQTSAKRKCKAHVKESTSANKKKVVPAMFQKMKFRMSARLPFHREPNLNSTLYRISDHHTQEASSFFPCDRTLVSYGHHNNGQREANHVFHQLPGYHHHNYQQPIPRFKSMYPGSSFSVDCTGDACKGDVFFKQDVYKQRNILGKQGTIVGRIVEEIYLAPKRRHDFTIEVLRTKGSLLLCLLSVVVVKD
uniref:Zinc finger CCCH domain-containing protein 62-like n=1 Tax=Tanacetum cinerariifolium TaxID=118510 RepID=A0A6L2LQT3_TANCI|nr:zinc finger CCCH domain-containing protein 62-like [Tanacetum cinerariifolium]